MDVGGPGPPNTMNDFSVFLSANLKVKEHKFHWIPI